MNEKISLSDDSNTNHELQYSSLTVPGSNFSSSHFESNSHNLKARSSIKLDRRNVNKATKIGDKSQFEFEERKIDDVISYKLREGAKQYSISLEVFFQAIWAILLNRYKQDNHIIFGLIVSSVRSNNQINNIPFHVIFEEEDTVKNLLEKTKLSMVSIEERKCDHKSSNNMLSDPFLKSGSFETLFIFNRTMHPTNLNYIHQNKYNLILQVLIEKNQNIKLKLFYKSSDFNKEMMINLINNYEYLFRNALENIQQKIKKINIISDHEKHLLLYDFNKTEKIYSESKLICDFFNEQVTKLPNKIAAIFNNEGLTYLQFKEKVNQLAHYLQKKGVRKEVLVGVCLGRSLEMLIAIFAVLEAGGAYVPIDPTYPKNRIGFILDDTNCQLVLTQTSVVSSLMLSNKYNKFIICIDKIANQLERQSKKNVLQTIKPDDLAYVIYTSGSTGLPKGVMIQHKSLINLLLSMREKILFKSNDNFLALTSIAFDVSIPEIFIPFISGATCVIANQFGMKEPKKIIEIIEEHNVSVLQSTPTILDMLFQQGWKNEQKVKIIVGAEPVPKKLVEKILVTTKDSWAFYGPTETTVWSTSCKIDKEYNYFDFYPIGQPLSNTKVFILDKNLELVPIGVTGDLYIGGVGLARGYLNRQEITKEKFIEYSLLNKKESKIKVQPSIHYRLYKTGDLAQWMQSGNIKYIGRLDNQVKIRGFRIELDEIEAALSQHPDIVQSVVIVRELNGEKQLVAYYIKKDNNSSVFDFSNEIRMMLSEILPGYMIPNLFIEVENFPRLPNWKVDRKKLSFSNRKVQDDRVVKARGEIEIVLINIWKDVLHIDSLSIDENFFLLGGHSLNAVQIVSQINKQFNTEYPISVIFENNTIRKLADVIRKKTNVPEMAKVMKFKRSKKKVNRSLSSGQRRLWFLDHYENANTAYNVSFAFRIKGNLDIPSLESSIKLLINRHQAFRSYFKHSKNGPLICIEKEISFSLKIAKVNKNNLLKLLNDEVAIRFNLAQVPLIRIKLFQLNKAEYILIITIHHIISDGRTIEIFKKELGECYKAYTNRKIPLLPKLEMEYLDLIEWQENPIHKGKIKKQLQYWKDKLQNFSTLNMPTDFVRPTKQNYSGNCYRFTIKEDLVEKLNKLSIKNNATLYMTMLTLFNILLSRYSGQDDILIGTTIDNRDLPESENVVGFFVNTLVLRNILSLQQSFMALLEQIKQNCLEAYANQLAPFDSIVQELQIERNVAYHPIFQIMFVWQNNSENIELEMPKLKTKPFFVNTSTAKFDLTFDFTFNHSKLECIIEYNTDLYRPLTIQRMSGHFQQLLREVIVKPNSPVATLQLLTSIEQNKILNSWNSPVKHRIPHSKIHQLFSRQAIKTPNNIALIYQDQKLTYAKLDQKSTQLAEVIRSSYQKLRLKAEKPVFIGLCVERSVEMIIGILGILKAGAAYVPLDPQLPLERLKFIIEDAECKIILTQETVKSEIINNITAIKEQKELIICLDKLYSNKSFSTLNQMSTNEFDLAYVIYTSGTTGNPKGVKQTHYNVLRLMAITQPKFNFNKHDVWTLFHSHVFDFSVWEMWGSLLYGGTLVIPTAEEVRDPFLFYQLVARQQVTVLNQTPTAFQAFVHEDSLNQNKLTALRYIIFGGEKLKIENLSEWWKKYGDIHPKLINMYGITETTVHTTYKLLKKKDLLMKGVSNIGKPLDDLTAYVLDRYLNPVPIGVPGELYIGNAGLAVGYLNQPKLTNQKFIESPFLRSAEKKRKKTEEIRLYKTGDLVRWLDDGSLEYLERVDNQVKINGFRIELTEIEYRLNKHSDVQQAIVQVIENQDVKQLVAYYVIKKNYKSINKDDLANKLRFYLKEYLPTYMVPNVFIELKEIPLTVNMKIDLKKLPKPNITNVPLNEDLTSEKITPPEKILLEIWQNVLRIPHIKITDNFFNLGGDSMTSIRIVYAAKERGLHFTVTDIFKNQTIKELAKKCDIYSEKENLNINDYIAPFALLNTKDKKRLPKNIDDAYPQAALQTGMLYHSITSPETSVYLDVFSYYVSTHYDDPNFRKALNFVVKENPILRTSFNMTDFSEPIQIVHQNVEVPISVVDINNLATQQQESIINKWMDREKIIPFNHERAPLLRICIHLIGENKFVLGMSFHHAIFDGWSVVIFITKLIRKYQQLVTDKNYLVVPSPDLNYKFFVHLEKIAIEAKQNEDFWAKELAEFHFTQITPWPNSNQKDVLEEIEIPIDYDLSKKLHLLAKETNVSLDVILLCAHLKLLSILSNSDDVTTGMVFNGRPEIESGEKTLGLFLNSLPFRFRIHDCSWKDLILSIAAKKTKIYPYRHYPLSKLYEDNGSHDPFDILFYFVNFHVYRELEIENGIQIFPRKLFERTNFPLVFASSLNQDNVTISCFLKYSSKVYSKSQIEALTEYYQKILQTMVYIPSSFHKNFNSLTCKEKDEILYQWNGTKEEYSATKLTLNFFEEQVELYPNKIAVIFDNQYLTYSELNQQANQLAHYLRRLGVKRDVFVAVYIERSLEMIIAALAIFKTGGVYVPLDLSYPQERIRFMLDDTACRFVLTKTQELTSLNLPIVYRKFCICLDEVTDKLAAFSKKNLDVKATPNDLAYVIYTSGSTGEPKGVMVEHRSLANLLLYVRKKIVLTQEDIFLALSSISFDISIAEFFLPLISGATCALGDRTMARNPQQIIDSIEKYKVTIMQATPTAWRILFDYGWKNSSNIKILSTGEALAGDLVQKINCYSTENWNLYGPTETTIWASLCPISKSFTYMDNCPIGTPIANTTALILNRNLELCPIGVPGELYIGGVALARGYLNKPELTKKSFVENLLSNSQNLELRRLNDKTTRWYKTGDLAQWLPDGNIKYVGRIDNQIKIRGHRIEPGEIEFHLLHYKKIKQCAVVMKKQGEHERLTAYILWHRNVEPVDSKEIKNFLRKKLPEFMIPEKIFVLDELPINASGKIDKKRLEILSVSELCDTDEYISPETLTEMKLAKIWREILHTKRVSKNDNFFDLGGNSIFTLQMLGRINDIFGISLDIRHIIESPSLTELSKMIFSLKKHNKKIISPPSIYFAKQIPDPVIKLQEKGSQIPLFLIHPIGGGVFYYLPLVKELGIERPIYGIQDPGIEAKDLLFHSLKEMASFYITAMKRYQPLGPYFIGGSSFGSHVAVEMARQLTDQGEKVAFLGLLDGIAKYPDIVTQDRETFENHLKAQMLYLHDKLPNVDIPDLFFELHWHRQQMMVHYVIPNLSDLKLTLFKATDVLELLKSMQSESNFWSQYNPKVLEIYKVPGDHLTMHFKPYVSELAKILSGCLIEAEKFITS